MSKVFLLDSAKVPLEPIHPGRARLLLKAGKAAVYRRYPFTLILKHQVEQPAPEAHWLDAATVGASTPESLHTTNIVPLLIKATGRGHRRICNPNEIGLPVSHRKRHKRYFGYQTGDLVRAVVPQGARRGTHVGRVTVKASGYFAIQTKTGKVPDIAHRYCKVQHQTDGYSYLFGVRLSLSSTSPKGAPVSSPA